MEGFFYLEISEQFLSRMSQLFAEGKRGAPGPDAKESSGEQPHWQHQLQAVAPEMLPAEPKSRDRAPAPGPWEYGAWLRDRPPPSMPAMLRCGPRHSKAWCRLE